ncbi:MAG: hypothetical protein ACTS5I_01090 [Rhodanobacter sp.]
MVNFLKSFTYSFVALILALAIVPGAQQLPTEELFLYWLLASGAGAWALPRLAAFAANVRPLPGEQASEAPADVEQSFDFDDEDIQFVEVTQ